jgi:hypothetical protein
MFTLYFLFLFLGSSKGGARDGLLSTHFLLFSSNRRGAVRSHAQGILACSLLTNQNEVADPDLERIRIIMSWSIWIRIQNANPDPGVKIALFVGSYVDVPNTFSLGC